MSNDEETHEEFDERARQAAHVLLDMLSAWDGTPVAEAGGRAIRLAASRLNDIDAIRLWVDDETDQHTVNIDPVLRGALDVMVLLTAEVLTHRPNLDGAQVISAMRVGVDADHE